jgi:diguanylate cyclase (GGDEF)-like protein
MPSIKQNPIKYFLFFPLLLILFSAYSYFSFSYQLNPVISFPIYIIFSLIAFFGYGLVYSIVISSIITLLGLAGVFLLEGDLRFFLLGEIVFSWSLFFFFSKYNLRQKDIDERINIVFEEVDQEKKDLAKDYSKDLEYMEILRERLNRYNNLGDMANKFSKTLSRELDDMANKFSNNMSLKEIQDLIIKTVKDTIKNTGKVRISSIDDDSIFVSWVRKQEVPLFVENIDLDYRFTNQIARESNFKSIMVVPLWNERKVYSFIEILSEIPNCYKEEDLRVILTISDIASLAITNAMLFLKKQELMITDGLTNVYNRRYFAEICADELMRVKRYNIPLSLLIIDIDYFKHYNDTYGHLEGDKILSAVAKTLKESVRETDLVARYGGEEFVVMLVVSTFDDAYHKAEQIRASIEEKCSVTVSVGIALANKNNTVEELVANADNALYKAKDEGRNRVICARQITA